MQNVRESLSVKCKIDGCERFAMYIQKELCQKHYFRIMRNGHPKLLMATDDEIGLRSRKESVITPNGYRRIYSPSHPLAVEKWVFEHRFVMYKKYGESLPNCEVCGKEINWNNCHIDHKDENRLNNDEDNLRPLCRACNTTRTKRSTTKRYEYKGEMLSVTELSKVDGVLIGRPQLKLRLDSGMSLNDAMFKEKKTHKAYKGIH